MVERAEGIPGVGQNLPQSGLAVLTQLEGVRIDDDLSNVDPNGVLQTPMKMRIAAASFVRKQVKKFGTSKLVLSAHLCRCSLSLGFQNDMSRVDIEAPSGVGEPLGVVFETSSPLVSSSSHTAQAAVPLVGQGPGNATNIAPTSGQLTTSRSPAVVSETEAVPDESEDPTRSVSHR